MTPRPDRWLRRTQARLRLRASRLLPGSYPSADVVVCVHNALEHVRACLGSLRAKTRLPHRLILVNDGSGEPTTNFLRGFAARHGHVTYIENDAARGYTRAANQGLSASTGEFVILLNSDTIVTEDWLKRLLQAAKARPDGGIFGPLSNAAGWQSIPESLDEEERFVANTLPPGVSVDAYAQAIGAKAEPLYPRVWIVNGFCYMLSRRVIGTVGLLDEDSFPQGYGEEDDYSLRAARAGFKAYVVDNCYVFHAKSKSFTTARRRELIRPAQEMLRAKHRREVVSLAISETRENEELERARVHSALLAEASLAKAGRDLRQEPVRIAWILGGTDSVRQALEITRRIGAWGGSTLLIAPDDRSFQMLPAKAKVSRLDEVRSERFDAVVFSDAGMSAEARQIAADIHVHFHPAGASTSLGVHAQAPDLGDGGSLIHVADSTFSAEQLRALRPGVDLAGIVAGGVDTDSFRPRRVAQAYQLGCLGPEWLDDAAALAVLRSTVGLPRLELTRADLIDPALPSLIAGCRAFVSGARGEASALPLQAMACGVPVVIAAAADASDYAEHGSNALIVPADDLDAQREAARKLLTDNLLRRRLIKNGLHTAWRYSWNNITARFIDVLRRAREDRRRQ